MHGSLEKTVNAELKKSVKEISIDSIDPEFGVLKSHLDSLEERIQTTSLHPSNKFDPNMSIIVMGLPYGDGED